ncbi:hypothetical protein L208DRAFT_1230460 [Tricholoma matsutake]|nr:hypothetical protein L208DRAFT_1230460 [Tricholoma matsutake 945]
MSPCMFQIELCMAQLHSQYTLQDIISMASTGSGKTLCFLMPLLFNGGKLTIIVMALNLLGEQFGKQLEAASITAVSAIQNLEYRVIMINPKILMQQGGFCEKMLWSHTAFVSHIFNVKSGSIMIM